MQGHDKNDLPLHLHSSTLLLTIKPTYINLLRSEAVFVAQFDNSGEFPTEFMKSKISRAFDKIKICLPQRRYFAKIIITQF